MNMSPFVSQKRCCSNIPPGLVCRGQATCSMLNIPPPIRGLRADTNIRTHHHTHVCDRYRIDSKTPFSHRRCSTSLAVARRARFAYGFDVFLDDDAVPDLVHIKRLASDLLVGFQDEIEGVERFLPAFDTAERCRYELLPFAPWLCLPVLLAVDPEINIRGDV